MGKSKKNRRKTLHQQAHDRLNEMLSLGDSKKEDKKNGNTQQKIYSKNTYETYWKHIKYFIRWL